MCVFVCVCGMHVGAEGGRRKEVCVCVASVVSVYFVCCVWCMVVCVCVCLHVYIYLHCSVLHLECVRSTHTLHEMAHNVADLREY